MGVCSRWRFQYDALKRQRLHTPMVRGDNGQLRTATWAEALGAVAKAAAAVRGPEMAAVAGKLADAESMQALADLMRSLGAGNLRHEEACADACADVRSTYVANSGVAAAETADLILLVGTNPRLEAPVFNARIRKGFLDGATIALVGEPVDLTYPYTHLGTDAAALSALASGDFVQRLKAAKRPMVVVGPAVARRPDRDAVTRLLHTLVEKGDVVREGWNGYNVMHDSASRVAALDLGFAPSAAARAPGAPPPKFVYLLGADDYPEAAVPAGAFVVYQGHHGERGAARADVVLPGAAYTEKSGVYVNFEGRPQQTRAAAPLVGDAREDWRILRALSEVLGKRLPYDTHAALRSRLADVAPHFAAVGEVQRPVWLNGEYIKAITAAADKTALQAASLRTSIDNFFMTDAISRASPVMAKCVQARAAAAARP